MRKAPVAAALGAQRAATLRRLSALPDCSWDAPALPGWQVRDVVAHLVAIDEASVTGRILPALRSADDRRAFEAWNDRSVDRLADRSPAELLEALARWGHRLEVLVSRLPAAVGQLRLRSWLGPQPLLYFVCRRVLDEWVHECDIAWATDTHMRGQPVPAQPSVPDVLAVAVLYALPHVALPRSGRSAGVVRLVVETEEGRSRTWGLDFLRRQYGARVTAQPDAVVRTDAGTLALVTENRLPLAEVRPGGVRVEGDETAAADLLELLPSADGESR